jgi:hypothetical protein
MKLLERKRDIITQGVRRTVAMKMLKGSPVTLENIVNKTNVKMGGLNYSLLMDPNL